MFFIALLLLGIISLTKLKTDLFPDIDYPELSIYTEMRGVAPAEIEKYITIPLEKELSNLPDLVDIISYSRFSGSTIRLRFRWGVSMDRVIIKVKDILNEAVWSLPEGSQEPIINEVGPETKPLMGIIFPVHEEHHVDKIVKKKILSIPGVAKVEIRGGKKENYTIYIDPLKLTSYNMDFSSFLDKLRAEFTDIPGLKLKEEGREYPLTVSLKPESFDEFLERKIDGIKIKDFIKRYHTEREKDLVIVNGKRAIICFIYKTYDASPLNVSRDVRKKLNEIEDLEYEIFFDKSQFIKEAFNGLLFTLLLGILLSFLTLWLFTGNLSSAFVLAVNMPVAVLGTLLLCYIFKIDLNIVTIGGIAVGVGMLVDSSIIVLESIGRRMERDKNHLKSAIMGTEEVMGAIFASIITNCVVFFPMIFTYGIAGRLMKPFALAVIFSLFISLLSSLTLSPVLFSLIKPVNFIKPAWFFSVEKKALLLLRKFLKKFKRNIIIYGVVFLILISLSFFVKREIFPSLWTGKIKTHIVTQPDIDRNEFLNRLKEIMDKSGRKYVIIAKRELPEEEEIYVYNVKNVNKWRNFIEKNINVVSVSYSEFDNPEQEFLSSERPFLTEIKSPEYIIKIDRDKLALLRIDLDDLMEKINTSINGVEIGNIGGDKIILSSALSAEEFISLPVKKDSEFIELREVIEMEKRYVPSLIIHQNLKRVERIDTGYERRKVLGSLIFAFFVALLLVYMVLASQFESLSLPVIIIFSFPFAFIIVPSSLLMTGNSINSISLIGFILLAGISVNDAILLVDYFEKMRKRSKKNIETIIIEGVRRRLRPVLMTTFTTVFALLPLSLGIGPGTRLISSMAVVVIAGLLSSTFLTIFMIPALYKLFKGR